MSVGWREWIWVGGGTSAERKSPKSSVGENWCGSSLALGWHLASWALSGDTWSSLRAEYLSLSLALASGTSSVFKTSYTQGFLIEEMQGEWCANPTVKSLWNWHIIDTTSPHNEIPLHRWKESNFFLNLTQTKLNCQTKSSLIEFNLSAVFFICQFFIGNNFRTSDIPSGIRSPVALVEWSVVG